MKEQEYHFIGLGGIGMSALASILLDKKVKVSGSDLTENGAVKELIKRGACFFQGHEQSHISQEKVIVYSTSVKSENPEIKAAQKYQCPILHRSDLLNQLMTGYLPLTVAGTHGKTTTSALLVHILKCAGLNPSFAIGGLLEGENGRHGNGKYFIAEADESDGTFLKYSPYGSIITNVEKEHMDYYKTEENLHRAFRDFFSKISSSEHLFYCGDDPLLRSLSQGKGISYGFHPECQLAISSFVQNNWNIHFSLKWGDQLYPEITVPLVGKMHALNATAAFGLCLNLGIPEETIRQSLMTFKGVKRRLEVKGEIKNILFLDDYAHHPTEVKVTLSALKEAVGERRLIVFFQPHRFSRTADFLDQFALSFESADFVYVTDIYAAQEQEINGINSLKLVEKIQEIGNVPAAYLPCTEYVTFFREILRPHDVFVTMGAGDITGFGPHVISALQERPAQKYKVGLIFGGQSAEHEISLRSAHFVHQSLNSEFYDLLYFGIDKKGKWVLGEEAKLFLLEGKEICSPHAEPLLSDHVSDALRECDLFFPILHGPHGEDGTIQGFFEIIGKPYAGPDFRSCAVTMDKILTKRILQSVGVPTAPFISLGYRSWLKDRDNILSDLQSLRYPLFVKPAKMGSSIGVCRVENQVQLEAAIHQAFRFDDIVLVEEGVVNGREFEFAVMGHSHYGIKVASPGEKCAGGAFVDYQKKYSQNPTPTTVNPQMSQVLIDKGKEFVKKAYEALGITCMSRVDCLIDEADNFCFTEVNAIPGMTSLSLFPKIWARDGIKASELMDLWILYGLSRRRSQDRHEKML